MWGETILKKFFKAWRQKEAMEKRTPRLDEIEVVEGVEGVWHYHLRRKGESAAICGNHRIMPTQIPLSYWGQKAEHILESYCPRCSDVKDAILRDRRTPTGIKELDDIMEGGIDPSDLSIIKGKGGKKS